MIFSYRMQGGTDRCGWRRSGQARPGVSLADGLNSRQKGDGIKASLDFNGQAIAKTDMDPGGFLLIGHEFKKRLEMCFTRFLVLESTPPIIESVPVDLVFSAEGGSGQAAVDLFVDQALPVG